MSWLPFSVWKNPHRLIMGKYFDHSSASFLDGSSSFLQVIAQPTKKAWMSSNFGKIPSLTSELAVLERLKNQ